MTDAESISIVLRAAEQNANGNERCAEIHQAMKRVKELFGAVKRQQVELELDDDVIDLARKLNKSS